MTGDELPDPRLPRGPSWDAQVGPRRAEEITTRLAGEESADETLVAPAWWLPAGPPARPSGPPSPPGVQPAAPSGPPRSFGPPQPPEPPQPPRSGWDAGPPPTVMTVYGGPPLPAQLDGATQPPWSGGPYPAPPLWPAGPYPPPAPVYGGPPLPARNDAGQLSAGRWRGWLRRLFGR